MSTLDDLEAEASGERPAFLTKNPKITLDDLEAEAAAKPEHSGDRMARELRAESAAIGAAPMGKLQSATEGLGNALSLGFGDELNAAMSRGADIVRGKQGPTYSQYRDAERGIQHKAAGDNPWSYAAGGLAGDVGTTLVPAGKPVEGVAQATKQAMKLGALSGAGNTEADLAGGDVGGFAKDVATSSLTSGVLGGGLSKLIRRAPERVDERMLANISRGEAGGAAKPRLYQNLVTKAGEDAAELNETLARLPGVKAAIVTNAASNPKAAQKVTGAALGKLTEEAAPIYKAIDAGPASPKATQLADRILSMKQAMVDKGRTDIADALETFEHHLTKHFGDGDAVRDDAPLTASMLREMRKGIGQIAFKDIANSNTPTGIEAKRMIYGAINDVIGEAAQKTPGVDANRLRTLNRDMSQLIAVNDALADRSTKAAAGRTSLFQNILAGGAGASALGSFTHDPVGAVVGAPGAMGAVKGVKLATQGARIADWQLAQLTLAARKGSTPAQLGQMAIELGLSRAAGDEIAKRIGGVPGADPKDSGGIE